MRQTRQHMRQEMGQTRLQEAWGGGERWSTDDAADEADTAACKADTADEAADEETGRQMWQLFGQHVTGEAAEVADEAAYMEEEADEAADEAAGAATR